jgi:hypothetical protein
MKRLLVRISFFFRRLACRIFGHASTNASIGSIGIKFCTRCLIITDQKTVRRSTTHGDIERRLRARAPEGYSLIDCNWKKRKAKFAGPQGQLEFVAF